MYTSGKNLGEIITMMNKLDLKPPKGGKTWYKSTIQRILTNITYIGKIRYVDKKTIKKRSDIGTIIYVKNPNPDVYLVNGLHEAIITEEMFEKAQTIYKSNQLADTRTKDQFELKNPLSTLLKCKICGRTLKRNSTESSRYIRIACKNHDVGSSPLELVEERVFESLKILLNDYKIDLNKTNNNEIINLISNTDMQINQLHSELEKILSQKNKLYDFLEQGIYDSTTFLERTNLLISKINDTNNKIKDLQSLKSSYESIKQRKENFIPNLKRVIDIYPYASIEEKNKLLKSCIEKIVYFKPKGSRKKDEFEIILYPRL